ncbi:PsbP domain-containing protein 2, chloroplastic [Sesamum alatum]|uniref:PsbP domain-containing protein 2, chloroplastic n=1 Tax=Sesamum alatum TaxID=300844 RepID=A0AAE2CC37_9LAMI|nr:PsbP domain-containing protein 2, chloroplastic [Sesamum alatum]
MAFCGISLPSSHQHHPHFLIVQNFSVVPSSLPPKSPRPPLSPFSATTTSSSSLSSSSCSVKCSERLPVGLDRRIFNLSIVGFLLSIDEPFTRFLFFSKALASQVLELDRYTDSKEGFTLLVPSSWIKVDKAGATVLFEDADKKANNVGVVVSPTRISSLGEFGTPQFVADKLIQAEKRKESTKEAEVISISERKGHAGLQVYEFEYKVDSTRGGLKRVFSAAFVTSKKLYLLNITHSDGLENPLDVERRRILEQVLHSFDAIPST